MSTESKSPDAPPRKRLSARELEEAVQRHIDAENRHDLDALMATVAEDNVFFHVMATGEKIHDHAGVRRYYAQYLDVPDLHFEPRSFVADPERSTVVVEYTLTGTFPLPYLGASQPRKAKLDAVTIYEVDGAGKICKEVGYYDQASLLASLGLVVDPKKPLGQLLLLGTQSPIHAVSTLLSQLVGKKRRL